METIQLKMKKFLTCILVSSSMLFSITLMAQTNNYTAEWKKIDQLIQKGLPKSALAGINKIMQSALAGKNQPQQVKAAIYLILCRSYFEETYLEKSIYTLDTLISKTSAPAKNILQTIQAGMYWKYKKINRYKLYSRTALVDENSKDISTWSLQKLNLQINALYTASLKNDDLLKNTSLQNFEAILQKGTNTRQLRPTLYDLLAHRALNYYMDEENDVTNPSYKFIINDEKAFSPADQFVTTVFSSKDSSSQYLQALHLLQNILKFHLADINTEALLDADLIRLNFVNQQGIFNSKNQLYENALLAVEKNYSTLPATAQAMYLRALIYKNKGNDYNPLTDTTNRFEIKKAKEICEVAITKYPNSDGAINCSNLLSQINAPSLQMSAEKVNVPNMPFRILVQFKNIEKIYLRAIKTSRQELKKIHSYNDYSKQWSEIAAKKPEKEWIVNLPQTNDFQNHSLEIKANSLNEGTYIILASVEPNFKTVNNYMAKQIVFISNISYVTNNKSQLYVLNRSSGMPIANATVQTWQQNYNYNSRSYVDLKKEKYTTDKNGFVQLVNKDEDYNSELYQITHEKDELFTDDYYYERHNSVYPEGQYHRTFFFADRSIYRPGQTVFFKGIALSTNQKTRKSEIAAGYKTTVQLLNANAKKITSLQSTANDYGSFNGSFKLPEGLLNGIFYLKDSVNNGMLAFSVEEYKRPKFSVEIIKPAGTYRVNDSIKVTGNAKGYAGNNIDGALVKYRVVRMVQYPYWWGYRGKIWPPHGNNNQVEISNGTTQTGADGNFSIKFLAIPDETADKKNQPVFTYQVIANVTDINGETRSAETNIDVSYQALQLEIASAEKISADSINSILITSKNSNGIFEKTAVKVTLQKLSAPNRIFRNRYWHQPDLFIMSKEEYYQNFPYDVYANEDQAGTWPVNETITEKTDSTKENGKYSFSQKPLAAGWYKISAITKDKYGEQVNAERLVYLVQKDNTIHARVMAKAKNESKQKKKTNFTLKTGFDKIWSIVSISRNENSTTTQYAFVTGNKPLNTELTITENDRGGINIAYVFVKNNRVYSGSNTIQIPWSNKKLHIRYETFREKLLPGSEEKWKIKISGEKADKVAAEALISMYDASLDQFKPHSWNSLINLWPLLNNYSSFTSRNFMLLNSTEFNNVSVKYLQEKEKFYDVLLDKGLLFNEFQPKQKNTVGFSTLNNAEINEGNIAMAAPTEIEEGDADNPKHMKLPKQKREASGIAEILSDSISDRQVNNPQNNNFTFRKNFNETALFLPDLKTDAEGTIEFSFTMPEALTSWKMMALAYDKNLASVYDEKTIITQKPLMVQPFAPRFMREGDQMEFSAKIVNLSDKEITGTSQLQLLDAATNQPVDGWFKNVFPNQYFTVAAGKSVLVKFPMEIPYQFNSAMVYRIKAIAKDGSFSDGEEMALPVLTNRTLVTESLPLNLRNTSNKNFTFSKLLNANVSGTLTHQSLTVEFTSNPAWYAIQSLPYLMEYPYECAEQTFNRYYANSLAAFIAGSMPKIKAVFEKWKTIDTAAILGNLQKNEELKLVLLQETPWVLQAQNENEQKKNIALLFDLVRLANEKNNTLKKIAEAQTSNGGFSWFKGGPDDRYITQYILTGIGHLRKLNAISKDDYSSLTPIVEKALKYLDARIKEDYAYLLKHKFKTSQNNLSGFAIQYLYMRSFFPEYPISSSLQKADNYYRSQSKKYWTGFGKYYQGMIALSLFRNSDEITAKKIINSLKENAIESEEMGMYWKDFTKRGYYWYQSPIESHSLLIEAFSDIDKNLQTVDNLKTWLLKNKQTNSWESTKATAEACYALLLKGSNWLSEDKNVTIQLGNLSLSTADDKVEAGTGYFKQTIAGNKVQQGMGNIIVTVKPQSTATSWGAVYWQYFEDLDKITTAQTPLKLVKKLFVEKNSASGPVLQVINEGDELKVGDKVVVRIELYADREMEYVHMKDMRAACMEPVNVLSSYKWQGGLGYYESTKDASTNFFFPYLPKGNFVFEYPMYVTHAGNFSNGITSIQCMYAPEFSSHSEGIRVNAIP